MEMLEPSDWLLRGHDLQGGQYDLRGFWRHRVKSGKFLWTPPPAVADVALEQLRIARLKRQNSLHVYVCPRLFTPVWFKQFAKAIDMYIVCKPELSFWPASMHEPLLIGVCFPFIKSAPWQLKRTPKVLSVVREVHHLLQENELAAGDCLRKFLRESRRLSSMPQDVVWRMLYFTSREQVPHLQMRGYKRKGERSQGYCSPGKSMGQKRAKA